MNALLWALLTQAFDYQVGAAKEDVTPKEPILLAGWKGRNKPIGDVAQPLFARALAIKDKAGKVSLIVSVDSIGFGPGYSDGVLKRVESLGVSRDRFVLCATHNHFAPEVAAWSNYRWPVATAEQRVVLERYTQELGEQIVKACRAAVKALAPARLSFGRGSADFARNRRGETAVDHDLPVLRMQSEDGALRALLFGYACHCVTADRNRISGDWAGLSSEYLEAAHPGAVALCVIGCGGDQDSNQPTELCARAVQRTVSGLKQFRPIRGPVAGKFVRADLPLQAGGRSFSYPIQTLNFGEDLTLIFLAGEVVVDYSLRLKQVFDPEKIMVVAYANEVAAYIPSLRVLTAGGYEGETANTTGPYSGQAGKFTANVEEIIVGKVRGLVSPKSARAPRK